MNYAILCPNMLIFIVVSIQRALPTLGSLSQSLDLASACCLPNVAMWEHSPEGETFQGFGESTLRLFTFRGRVFSKRFVSHLGDL